VEIGNSKIDYTIDRQFYDGRENSLESRVEGVKQKLHSLEKEEGSSPELSQMIAQITGLGSRLDLAV